MNQTAQDQIVRIGGGAASTTLTLGTAVLVGVAILLIFLLPRKYAIVPYLFLTLFIPNAQVLMIGGLHFMVFRIVLPFIWLRALMGSGGDPSKKFQWNGIDKAIVLWAITDTVCSTILWGSWEATANRMGFLYNVLGLYFLLRLLIRDREDVGRAIKTLAVVCVFFAAFMVLEQITGRNVFSIFGGVPLFTEIRDGRLRSQAAFAHAIVAGTVGANLIPLFIGLWWQGAKSKFIAGAGILAALIMMVTSSSATPIGAFIVGVGSLFLWRYRHSLKIFRWGFLITLVALDMVMKAPVWALIARINLVGGNSGYHRYELINQAILHFSDWFLVGTKETASWGYYMDDVSNAYVTVATDGGLLTLLFYLAIFWQCFRRLGLARKAAEIAGDKKLELQVWSFGCALTGTIVAYFGIYYFDQSQVIWWSLLAMICAISSAAFACAPEPAQDAKPMIPWAQRPLPAGSLASLDAHHARR